MNISRTKFHIIVIVDPLYVDHNSNCMENGLIKIKLNKRSSSFDYVFVFFLFTLYDNSLRHICMVFFNFLFVVVVVLTERNFPNVTHVRHIP